MSLDDFVQWTKNKLSRFTDRDVPVTSGHTLDALTAGTVVVPSLDLFENQREYRLVLDAPGATTRNTHATWDDIDTLAIHVPRAVSSPGTPWLTEYQESGWYREVILSADVDAAKASSTVREGVVTIRLPKRKTASSTLVPVHAG